MSEKKAISDIGSVICEILLELRAVPFREMKGAGGSETR